MQKEWGGKAPHLKSMGALELMPSTRHMSDCQNHISIQGSTLFKDQWINGCKVICCFSKIDACVSAARGLCRGLPMVHQFYCHFLAAFQCFFWQTCNGKDIVA